MRRSLVVAVLSPLAIILFGLWVNRKLKRFELLQWCNQKVVERRLSVFEELAPLLNDLLCYFTYVGCWKEKTPIEIIKLKRQLDRIVYVQAPLFPPRFVERYNGFICQCYQMYTGLVDDAKLRTHKERRKKAAGDAWKSEWDNCFTVESEAADPKEVRHAYGEFMNYFARELGVGVQTERVLVGHPPAKVQ